MIAQPPISLPRAEAAIHARLEATDRPDRLTLTECRRYGRVAVTCQIEEEHPRGVFTIEWEVEPEEAPMRFITNFSATATLRGHHIVIS